MKIEDFLKENLKLVKRQQLLHLASIKYLTHVVFLMIGVSKGMLNGKLKLLDRFIILCILSVIVGTAFFMIKSLLLFFVVIINLKFPDALNPKEQWIVSSILFYSVLVLISFIRIHIIPSSAERIYKHAYKTYKDSAQQRFTEDEFKKAALAMKEFKPVSYEHAVQKYGDRIIDLLYICSALTYDKGKLKRMISLKALEEDREANAADDLEENSYLP